MKKVFLCLALLTLLVGSCIVQAAISPRERKETLEFLKEFADEYKMLKYTWTGDDYCNWDGVTCDAKDDVYVNLRNRGLEGDLPEGDDDYEGLVRVVSIDMSQNYGIDDDLDSDWRYLTNLRVLNLSYTSIKGYVPDKWRSMSSLEEVYMHHTALCRNLPDWSAATMPNLRVVDMSYNNFMGDLLRGDWTSFTKLEKINLRGNSFCRCPPTSWNGNAMLMAAIANTPAANTATCATTQCSSSCPSKPNTGSDDDSDAGEPVQPTTPSATLLFLQYLASNLRLTAWTGTDYCTWQGVSCASANDTVTVNLRGQGLSGTLPEVSNEIDMGAVGVVSLDLSVNTGITGTFPDSWAGLRKLHSLKLSDTSLRGQIPNSWNGMVSLEEIEIRNTGACYGLPDWNMVSLWRADLSNNKMRGSLASAWNGMSSHLRFVDISGNYFCGCMPSSWTGVPVLEQAVAQLHNTVRNPFCAILNTCTSLAAVCDL